jgi:hypothetical protein
MDILLPALPRNRYAIKCKIIWAGLFAVLSALIAFVPKIVSVHMALGYEMLNAPIQSLLFMRSPFRNISILSYIIGIVALWVLLACVGAALAIAASSKTKSRAVSVLAICLLLLITFFIAGTITNQF